MAKQYVCKVCGYVHTGDKAPDVCPQCKQSNCFEEVKKKGFNTDSNLYTIVYATVIVVVVAVLLALVSQILGPRQKANALLDQQKQILTSLNVDYSKSDAAALYQEIVKDETFGELPLYVATIDGATKYVLRLHGQGLWGGIWGYIALNDDLNTIYGINFGHESETPGLGGEIVTENFRSRFFGKHIKDSEGALRSVAVLKVGKTAEEGQEQVDAWAGATITSTGVNDMLLNSLNEYAGFLSTVQATEATLEEAEVVEANDSIQNIEENVEQITEEE